MSEPEVILLRAADGNNYPVRPLNKNSLERLKVFIRQRALSAYYDWAFSPAGLARTNDEDRARAVAQIASRQPSLDEVVSAWTSVDGFLWLLREFMEPLNKGLTEETVERLFGPVVYETMSHWAVESGFTSPSPDEVTTDGTDPTTNGKTDGTGPPP